MKLSADEKMEIEDQAYDKAMENMLAAYEKIITKAEFLIKLCTPLRFKKKKPSGSITVLNKASTSIVVQDKDGREKLQS
jgi:hypothetical protein